MKYAVCPPQGQRYEYLSGKKSRPRTTSTVFFAAPTNGVAFRTLSSAPRKTPFRRIAAPTIAMAIAVPIQGIDRLSRRDNLNPPHRARRFVMTMSE
jgi:hypothetical protein